MTKIDDLLIGMVQGSVPCVPSVTKHKLVFLDSLGRDSASKEIISQFLLRAGSEAKTAVREFKKGFKDDVEELTAIGNAARTALSWIYDLEQALLEPDRLKMVVLAAGPMGWLETFIKTLQYKSLTRQA